MIFDSHAHYDDEAFNEDRDELLSSMNNNGIGYIVNIGASIATTKETIKLTEQYDFIYGTAGVHPCEVNELNEDNFSELQSAVKNPKIIGVGEIGLDYYWKEVKPEIQKIWFERQLDLAGNVNLPVVIHSRDACKDTLDMMKSLKAGDMGGVIHCYSYGTETAREYLNMGFYLGIGGVITFNNAKKLKEVVSYMPLDKIVIETDCPYLSPVPNRGKRNSSLNLGYVIKEIAEIKKLDEEEVIDKTFQNAMKMYKIKE